MDNLKILRDIGRHTIFWGWNFIFITVFYCGILPFIGIWLIISTFEGTTPLDFSLTFLGLVALPPICTIYGLKYLRNQPQELMRWFFGVEAPLIVWCLCRLFIIREFNPASALVLGTLLVSIVAFAIEILQGYQANRPIFSWVQMIAHTLMIFTGVYLGAVLLFYALPVGTWVILGIFHFIVGFFSFGWIADLGRELSYLNGMEALYIFFIFCLFATLFGFSAIIFAGMPFALTKLLLDSGKKVFQAFAQQHGMARAMQVGVGVVAAWLVMFNFFNQQPQVAAFKLLEQSPVNRAELLAASRKIRQGLVNANLYPYRYLSTKEGNDHIYRMYESLGLPKPAAEFCQTRYNQLMAPFLYQGDRDDVKKSAQLYAEFFDTPIQKAEAKAVRHAIQSTAIVDQAKAGLLNIDQKKVWLAQQDIEIKPHGTVADVEIHEVYENQTNDVEEILYYFSLPESAAITGVWLGETADLDQRFTHQVSPRGAAQEVYNNQVRRVRPVDPALLEQVGPGQYRLRAFPVPPKRIVTNDGINWQTPQMHLWLTYQVMQQKQGWPLPKLAEKRNIYWNWHTKRTLNGQKQRFSSDRWLEDFAPAGIIAPSVKQVILDGGYQVTAQPLTAHDDSLPQDQNYAVLVDTSYSMDQQKKELQSTLSWIQNNLSDNQLDLYLTDVQAERAKLITDFSRFTQQPLTFYGSLTTDQLLRQFAALRQERKYDAIFVLTDVGSYELSSDGVKLPEISAPLWLIHLGGELPRAYQDQILQAIQNSHGGVDTNLEKVLHRLAVESSRQAAVMDGFSWSVSLADTKPQVDSSWQAIASRQLVKKLAEPENLSLEKLDQIHQIAKKYDIVTSYSSMIVLVNDQQREQLKAAEAQSDRFERESASQ